MKKQIVDHFLQNDAILHAAYVRGGRQLDALVPSKTTEYFADLCEAIVNQQLSDKAGRTIFSRFASLFPKRRITPKHIVSLKEEDIKSAGLSWSKTRFITSLARSFINKDIDFSLLPTLSDEAVVGELVKLKGIGKWTAEMFLMFSLGRENVFSFGDLGLRRAIEKLYGFKKPPTDRQIAKIITSWSPYKTYACTILWRSLDM